ncbi:VOC family protein [Bacillus sp. SG-1]|uniref:VOC family protein n=1 Tax=Bacillus sp. SG-1 TaxID=161544 RepID=UPI000154562C|nr:VOC family protein [Bacillus sp. SG-1]EDL63126.1 glyoxalase/bleomycin resistance protein [Bacillus sp. SG-1]
MTFKMIGLDHIQLAAPAGSEDRERQFYGKVLGMKEMEKPEKLKAGGGCWFHCGNQELHIGVETDFSPALKAHPGIVVKNIEAVRSRLEENGYEVKEDTKIEDRKRIFVNDPFGNRVEFLEYN